MKFSSFSFLSLFLSPGQCMASLDLSIVFDYENHKESYNLGTSLSKDYDQIGKKKKTHRRSLGCFGEKDKAQCHLFRVSFSDESPQFSSPISIIYPENYQGRQGLGFWD